MTRDLPDNNHEHAPAEAFATNMPAAEDDDALQAHLTAYVLGELSDGERAAVEAALARSEDNRAMVDAIRHSAELMSAALATEPPRALSQGNRERLEESIKRVEAPTISLPVPRRRLTRRRFAAASAACLVLGFSGWLLWPAMQAARESRRSIAASSDLADKFVGRAKSRAIQDGGTVSTANAYKQDFEAATGATAAARPAKKNPKEVTYTINKPIYETKTRGASDGPTLLDPVPKPAPDSVRLAVTPRITVEEGERGLMPADPIPAAAKDSSIALPADGYFDFSGQQFNRETYDGIVDNPFLDVRQNPLSTFSIDVDTASYANVRRFLNQGALPPKDAVRIEELVNYFKYHYAPPADDAPFAVHAAIAGCPWKPEHRLLRVALKGREIDFNNRPASNLVFLIDVSGSMDEPNKLPLLKAALRLLVDRLSENDRVAMVVYAGSSGLALPSTSGERQAVIASALEQLQAGGSTNGGEGIQLAYDTARQNFIRGGTNRVILCTDGDFNVGITDQGSLTRLIEDQAKSGVFLSVLGFGTGNYQDSTMEKLADRGNGNYAYIDNLDEARKTLVGQAGGTLVTIAKDVKLQLEFNPQQVAAYRLIGYENRLLRDEDFNDDTKDAGEIGAGHTVTAFYELVPAGGETPATAVDALKYQQQVQLTDAAQSDETLTLKLRYKLPDSAESKLLTHVVKDAGARFSAADNDLQFAAAVAGLGLLLRDSPYKGNLTYAGVLELASAARGSDEEGYRADFIELVKKAQAIAGK